MATDFTRAIRGRNTEEVLLTLVTISHASMNTIRRVDNTADVQSRSNTWLARTTTVTLPKEAERGATTGRIILDDTDLSVSSELRKASTPATVLLEIVLASAVDTVRKSYRSLEVKSMSASEGVVTLGIGLADFRTEAFPSLSFSLDTFPELG